ncbi:hypothetical protein BRADI_3g59147v3 [Brachypodium distachyon]|uniref:Uncharacterized protein n=1 Tax=Brachypodium distachyon TaxID=15368 RepID=I1IF78_BRADI|nr:hypothetical protein BRADI_3g59147v3 [Brachypodium distachyon]
MLRLQKQFLSLRCAATPGFFSVRLALLSTAASAASPPSVRFAAEDYLVTTCGLTRDLARKSTKYISHWKCTSNADSVLAFLGGAPLCLSKADIAKVVAVDPRILNCSVEKNLKIRIASFRSHGLSDAQVQTFARTAPYVLRSFNVQERLGFWLPFLGSPEMFLRIVRRNFYILTSDLEKVVKPNIELLQECGLTACVIAKMCIPSTGLLTRNPEAVRSILARADKLGVPRNSPMFRHAVTTMMALGTETMAAKLKFFSETLGCSEAEVINMVRRNPVVLRCSREKIRNVSEFLTNVVRIDARCTLSRPTMLMYSLECRLVPRYYVMKVLQEKGLIQKDITFYTLLTLGDELFRCRYIHPHKDVLPGLDDEYTNACQGKLPAGVAL